MSKVWLITGSSRGLGRKVAEAVVAAGDLVVATARKPKQLEDLVDRYGDHVHAVKLDVTNAAAAAGTVQTATTAFGRLDVVVNNAGFADTAVVAPRTSFLNNRFPESSGWILFFNDVCVLVTAAFALTLVPGFRRPERSLLSGHNKGTALLVFTILALIEEATVSRGGLLNERIVAVCAGGCNDYWGARFSWRCVARLERAPR